MDLTRLQRQAAAAADELLDISRETETGVIAVYGTAPAAMTDMQCRILLERCRRLAVKLEQIQKELSVPESADSSDIKTEEPVRQMSSGMSGAREYSVAVTRQMTAQNLLLLSQKEELLKGFLTHSDTIQARLAEAREMSDAAEIIRLRNILRGEAAPCRSEKE